MKKLVTLLLALVVLTGCKDARVNISDDSALFSIGEKTVMKSQLFDVMKLSDAGMLVVQDAQMKLTQTIKDEAVQEEADKRLNEIKAIFGENYETQIKNSGYKDVDDFMTQTVIPELKMTQLLKDTMNQDFQALADEYKPVKAHILEIESKEKAEEAVKAYEASSDFKKVSSDFMKSGSMYTGEERVHVVKSTQFPKGVATALTDGTVNKLSDIIDSDSGDSKYLVLITNNDANSMKEDVLKTFTEVTEIANKYLAKLFVDNGFTLYDKDLYQSISEKYPAYLGITEQKKEA